MYTPLPRVARGGRARHPTAALLAGLLLGALTATSAAQDEDADSEPFVPDTTPMSHVMLHDRLDDLADEHDLASLIVIGESFGGRDIEALVLAAGDTPLAERNGVILVGDPAGDRTLDASVLVGVAEHLLAMDDMERHLGGRAILIVPRPAPDGAERLLVSEPRHEQDGNGRPDDRDRDGRTDEDGPADLNGDGYVTWMRVPDPDGEWVIDEHDPRALRKAKRDEGERGTHELMLEGADDDGDGELNEDGTEGVHADANFPHGWQDHDPGTGDFPLSEPEAMALARLVLDHPGFGIVVQVGAADTLVKTPKADDKPKRGGWRNSFQAPLKGLLKDDVAPMEELSRRFKRADEDTEHEVEGKGLEAGSFLAWTYHQGGRWPLALRPWAPPTDFPKKEKPEEEQQDEAPAAEGEEEPDAEAENESADETDAGDETDAADEPTSDEDSPVPAAVLAWLDKEHDGEGFFDWEAHEHPDLGSVEIGGLLPGLLENGPHEELAPVAAKLAAFTVELLDAAPAVSFEAPEVETRADGLYMVKTGLVNTGVLPTSSTFAAETNVARPLRVTLELPEGAELMNGAPQTLVSHLQGAGGRQEMRWIVAAPAGSRLTLRLDADTVADAELEIDLP